METFSPRERPSGRFRSSREGAKIDRSLILEGCFTIDSGAKDRRLESRASRTERILRPPGSRREAPDLVFTTSLDSSPASKPHRRQSYVLTLECITNSIRFFCERARTVRVTSIQVFCQENLSKTDDCRTLHREPHKRIAGVFQGKAQTAELYRATHLLRDSPADMHRHTRRCQASARVSRNSARARSTSALSAGPNT